MCSRCIHNSEHANGSQILVSQRLRPSTDFFLWGVCGWQIVWPEMLWSRHSWNSKWGTNLWAGSWTGMVVERKTPPINSFRIYPPKKHISHILTYPYMPWYLFYLFNLLCYVWWRIPQVRVQTSLKCSTFFLFVCCDGHFRSRIVGVNAEAGVAFVTGVVWEMLAVARARRETKNGDWKKQLGGFYLTKSERPSLKLT